MVHLLMRITLQWDINEMSYFYSASTNGFYSTEFHGTNIPDDAVEISESEWKTLINAQSVTKMITCGEDGLPVIVDRPSPTPEQLALINNEKKSALIAEATNVIAPLQDAVDLDMATDDETKLLLAWKKYRVLLMRVDTSTAPDIEWPTPPAVQAR